MDITPYSYQQEILDKLEVERKVRGYTRNLVMACVWRRIKRALTVLDFIGQANRKYNFEDKFAALLSHTTRSVTREIKDGLVSVPEGCYIQLEKKNSIFAKGGYTDKEAERNILSNPFKRFEDMQMLRHTKTLGIVQVDESVWKHLTKDELAEIDRICDEKLDAYYGRFYNVGVDIPENLLPA